MSKLNQNENIVPKTHVPPDCTEPLVKLRIRSENGQRNIMLTLLQTDTLTAVYKYVRPYVEAKGKSFELCTSFPSKSYAESLQGSLKDLGLAPSAVMIVKLL